MSLTSTSTSFAVATIAKEVETSADLTPAQLDDLGVAWLGLHVLWVSRRSSRPSL